MQVAPHAHVSPGRRGPYPPRDRGRSLINTPPAFTRPPLPPRGATSRTASSSCRLRTAAMLAYSQRPAATASCLPARAHPNKPQQHSRGPPLQAGVRGPRRLCATATKFGLPHVHMHPPTQTVHAQPYPSHSCNASCARSHSTACRFSSLIGALLSYSSSNSPLRACSSSCRPTRAPCPHSHCTTGNGTSL